ncbi:DUF1702 family protein [Cytobacillus pseudoceanisediminis]|uniref:DUF1702 family protein n=1 Tax=Cytobacillus pseudoceanisediminis TaxID=3051614 RepID=UPI003C2B7A1C
MLIYFLNFIIIALLVILVIYFGAITIIRRYLDHLIKNLNIVSTSFFDKRFKDIIDSFKVGFYSTIKLHLNYQKIRKSLDDTFQPYIQGFAYEGTGMGFGLRSTFHLKSAKQFEKYINRLSPQHIYQYYVGLGWWLQTIYGFNLKRYSKWLKNLDTMYGPILFDGVGFKIGIFAYKENPQILEKAYLLGNNNCRVFYQGFGRSLWFQKKFQIDEVLLEIEKLPEEFKRDCMSGVGLAVAYSFFDRIGLSFITANSVPEKYKDAFIQGMAFGWEARRLQHSEYWVKTLNETTDEIKQFVYQVLGYVHRSKDQINNKKNEDFYFCWIDQTRELIKTRA